MNKMAIILRALMELVHC